MIGTFDLTSLYPAGSIAHGMAASAAEPVQLLACEIHLYNHCHHHLCRYKAKVEEGLSRLLAFLREEEERERLEEIERLKPIGTPVGAYLEYRCKVEVGQVVRTDAGEVTIDNRCWVRTGHTLTQVRMVANKKLLSQECQALLQLL
jgi:hypothetical protein